MNFSLADGKNTRPIVEGDITRHGHLAALHLKGAGGFVRIQRQAARTAHDEIALGIGLADDGDRVCSALVSTVDVSAGDLRHTRTRSLCIRHLQFAVEIREAVKGGYKSAPLGINTLRNRQLTTARQGVKVHVAVVHAIQSRVSADGEGTHGNGGRSTHGLHMEGTTVERQIRRGIIRPLENGHLHRISPMVEPERTAGLNNDFTHLHGVGGVDLTACERQAEVYHAPLDCKRTLALTQVHVT